MREGGEARGAGCVVMSFDFEMRWGVHDYYGLDFDAYRENLENVRDIVPFMLSELSDRNLSATWATVGALGLNNWDDYFKHAPSPPCYEDNTLKVSEVYADLDPNGELHFAPDLVNAIVNSENQELGSHSFSHLYFREPGVSANDFLEDMAAVETIWTERYGVTPVSLIFPRNQTAFLDLLSDTSIKIWRGVEPRWFYDRTSSKTNKILPRAFRLFDSVNPYVKRSAPPEMGMLRASLFVRFSLPEVLWKCQIARVKHELSKLNNGDVLHLWWHPHNLGGKKMLCFSRLSQLMDLVGESIENRGLLSARMQDFV